MFTDTQNGRIVSTPLREWVGEKHYGDCIYRQYNFPVSVFLVNEDGVRELVRVEQ